MIQSFFFFFSFFFGAELIVWHLEVMILDQWLCMIYKLREVSHLQFWCHFFLVMNLCSMFMKIVLMT